MYTREEIQRIKAANPEIPHREAFSAAAKNVTLFIPLFKCACFIEFLYTHHKNKCFLICWPKLCHSGLGTFPIRQLVRFLELKKYVRICFHHYDCHHHSHLPLFCILSNWFMYAGMKELWKWRLIGREYWSKSIRCYINLS